MKLVLNTAIDPHFCAIFSEENVLVNKIFWTERVQDGKNIYEFIKRINPAKFSFCGGISGPGGFASLRATAGVLTSISIASNIPIHQISAEKFIANILGHEDFLLNSFGNAVWKIKNGEISRDSIENINLEKEWFVDFLPSKKRGIFPKKIRFSLDEIEKKLLENLLRGVPQNTFIPHYEVAPV
jgi:hypothetical protein